MNNMQAKAILEKEKLWESNDRVKTAFDIGIKALETVEKITPCYLGSPCEYQTEDVNHNHGWIPCSERMPEEYGEYLCCNKSGEFIVGYPKAKRLGDGFYVETDSEGLDFVVAWQPLPSPYEITI